MHWRRVRLLFSTRRLAACRRLFRSPWRAHLGLAFVTRRPVSVTLKQGGSLAFSRDKRDHLFWDWWFGQTEAAFDFTSEGELLLRMPTQTLLLRPGTTDFFIFREICVQDCYQLRKLPERLGTVVDLGGNIGLFSCAVLPRADRVIIVEPVHAHHRLARKNILANGGDPADVVRAAVTGRTGEPAVIHVAERHAGASSLFAAHSASFGISGRE